MWSSILKKSLSKLEGRIVRRSILKFTPSGSLDLKLRVLLQVQCACFDLWQESSGLDSTSRFCPLESSWAYRT